MTLKLFPFAIIEKNFLPQLQIFFLLQINWFLFSLVFQKFPEIGKTQKETIWLLMATPIIFRVWRASRKFHFLIKFFQKIQHKVLGLEIQSILSILWVWHLKIGRKSKNLSDSIRNDTKAGKTWLWNELRPKLFHQHLALIKRLLKKWLAT